MLSYFFVFLIGWLVHPCTSNTGGVSLPSIDTTSLRQRFAAFGVRTQDDDNDQHRRASRNPIHIGFHNALARYNHHLADSNNKRPSSIMSSSDTMERRIQAKVSFQHDDIGHQRHRRQSSAVPSSDQAVSSPITTASSQLEGIDQEDGQRRRQRPETMMTKMIVRSRQPFGRRQPQQQQQQEDLLNDDISSVAGCANKARRDMAQNQHEEKEQGLAPLSDTRGGSGRGKAAAVPAPSLSFVENMACGAVSRSIAQTMMHPMNTAKTMLQNGRGPDRPTLRMLMQRSQFRRLSCGAGANFVLSIPHGAVNFAVLEFVRGRLNKVMDSFENLDDRTRDALGPGLDFLSSALATVTCSVVSTPQMMITDNIMAGNFPNLVASVRGLYSNGGIVGLYAGMRLCVCVCSLSLSWKCVALVFRR
jgi:Mitochondrial carrier protein